MRRAAIMLLAVALAAGPAIGCKRDEPPPMVTVTAPLWIAPVAEDHPWVIAFLTEVSITRPPGADARLEGRTDPDGRYVPDPVFETEDKHALSSFLREYERAHPRPPELTPVWEQHPVEYDGRARWQLHFIDTQAGFLLDGGASATLDQTGEVPLVRLKFSPAQAERFTALTRAQVGRRVAFAIDDEVVNVPVVREEIPGGEVMLWPGAGSPEYAAALLERLQQPQ